MKANRQKARAEFKSVHLSYVSLRILLDGFALGGGVVVVAAVSVCSEGTSQAEEGGSEFHRRWATSWIGDGSCFGGTTFPHLLIL